MNSSKVHASLRDIIRVFIEKDPSVQGVIALPKASKTRQFWVEEDLLLTKVNKLYVPKAGDLRKKLLHEGDSTLWVGHLGWQKTYVLLKKGYFGLTCEMMSCSTRRISNHFFDTRQKNWV